MAIVCRHGCAHYRGIGVFPVLRRGKKRVELRRILLQDDATGALRDEDDRHFLGTGCRLLRGSDEASSDDGTGEAPDASRQGAAESTSEVIQTGTETGLCPMLASRRRALGASSPSAPAPESNRDVVTITVSVTSATVGNPVSAGPIQFTFERGATALDALVATGLSVNASSSAFGGSYVGRHRRTRRGYLRRVHGAGSTPSTGSIRRCRPVCTRSRTATSSSGAT